MECFSRFVKSMDDSVKQLSGTMERSAKKYEECTLFYLLYTSSHQIQLSLISFNNTQQLFFTDFMASLG